MIRSLTTSATGMEAQLENVDRIANNIANANTTAFKKSRTDFQDLLYQTMREPGTVDGEGNANPVGVQVGVGVKIAGSSRLNTQGAAKQTGRGTDLMINGEGYFGIQMPNGQVGYTRDGGFQVDNQGRLVTVDGYPLLPEIRIPQGSVGVEIKSTGEVLARQPDGNVNPVGQIQLIAFQNPNGLKATGRNLYSPTPASGAPIQGNPGSGVMGSIEQGFLEASNVNAVTEMVDMISAQRAFEMNSKAMMTADQMLQNVVNPR